MTHCLRLRLVIVLALAAVLTFTVSPFANAEEATPAATPAPVVREALVSAMPVAAPGQVLQLVRYTIPPHTTLKPHTHPGTQIAWIESGVLHYVVVEGGSIPVTRAAINGTPVPLESLGPGQETDLHPGDSVIETESVVHFGANLGDEPVIIWAAVLLTEGMPPAIVSTPAATPSG